MCASQGTVYGYLMSVIANKVAKYDLVNSGKRSVWKGRERKGKGERRRKTREKERGGGKGKETVQSKFFVSSFAST